MLVFVSMTSENLAARTMGGSEFYEHGTEIFYLWCSLAIRDMSSGNLSLRTVGALASVSTARKRMPARSVGGLASVSTVPGHFGMVQISVNHYRTGSGGFGCKNLIELNFDRKKSTPMDGRW